VECYTFRIPLDQIYSERYSEGTPILLAAPQELVQALEELVVARAQGQTVVERMVMVQER
jgi:hypothetical protein